MRVRRALLGLAAALAAGASPAAVRWSEVHRQPPEWHASAEARALADAVVQYQTPAGGWPKNVEMTSPPPAGFWTSGELNERLPTIDNGATTSQLAFLARVVSAAPHAAARAAVERGLDYLLAAQYANGGWPQFFPLRDGYYSHITFNDDAMLGVLRTLRAAAHGTAPYSWLDTGRRDRAAAAVERGVACIVRCQVRVDGVLTAWCAQHDAVTLAPAPARKFEPVSLSGAESAGLLRFLMQEPDPSPEVIAAVEAGMAWLDAVKITGWRLEHPRRTDGSGKRDQVIVADPAAPPLWARFYEIGTNRPIFAGRDAVVRGSLAEVEVERRSQYAYYGSWGAKLLAQDYPAWRARHADRLRSP